MKKKEQSGREVMLVGVVTIVCGVIMYSWVLSLLPNVEFGQLLSMLFKRGANFFSIVAIIAALLFLFGVFQLFLGLQKELNSSSGGNSNASIFCSECGAKCLGNAAFCGQCGSNLKGR